VYVVLRTKALGESTLETYLSRLAITLEARAVGTLLAKPTDGQSVAQPSQANELLFSEIIKNTEEPTILATEVQTEDDTEPSQFLYVFWKVEVHLGAYVSSRISKHSLQLIRPTKIQNTEARNLLCSFCVFATRRSYHARHQ
jgi:hypothetical protein